MMKPQHFCFRDNRLFFNVSSFSAVLGVKRVRATGAAMRYMESLPKTHKTDNIIPLGCSVPAYLDAHAFESVLSLLNDSGDAWNVDNARKIEEVLSMVFPDLPCIKSSLDDFWGVD